MTRMRLKGWSKKIFFPQMGVEHNMNVCLAASPKSVACISQVDTNISNNTAVSNYNSSVLVQLNILTLVILGFFHFINNISGLKIKSA